MKGREVMQDERRTRKGERKEDGIEEGEWVKTGLRPVQSDMAHSI